MVKFNYEEDKLLCSLVRQNECLWYSKHPKNKNCVVRNKAWRTIGKSLKRSDLEVKARWRTIRDNFTRKTHSNLEKTGTKRAIYWRLCRFLDLNNENISDQNSLAEVTKSLSECDENNSHDIENYDVSESEPNFLAEIILPLEINHEENGSSDIESVGLHEKENFSHECENIGTSTSSPVQNLAHIEQNKNNKFRKFHQDLLISTPQEDEVDLFFRSMAMTVKKFRPQLLTQAKMKVFQTVMEFEVLNQS